jgi:glycosyltransferase involved in cell wall biosynthesis
MKVLIFSHDWVPSVGGVQSAMLSLAQAIAGKASRDGHKLLGVVTQTEAPRTYDRKFSFTVFRRPGLLRLAKLIKNCDVLHLAGPALKPLILAKILGRKILIQHHGYQAACPDGLLVNSRTAKICENSFLRGKALDCLRCRASKVGWIRGAQSIALAFPRRWLSAGADSNVTVTNHVSSRLNLPASSTIYHGVPESSLQPVNNKAGRALGRPRFLFIGRLVPEKGVEVLLRAFAKLSASRTIELKIIGDGPDRDRLLALAKELQITKGVEFCGCLEGSELLHQVRCSAAVVVPSICEEAANLVAIEQMMNGTLIIAADLGGLSEVLGSAGLKFIPGSVVSLIRCMETALDNADLRRALGTAACVRAQQLFTVDRMVNEHLQLYRSVLRKTSSKKKALPWTPTPAWVSSVGDRVRSFITAS